MKKSVLFQTHSSVNVVMSTKSGCFLFHTLKQNSINITESVKSNNACAKAKQQSSGFWVQVKGFCNQDDHLKEVGIEQY